MDNAFVWLCIPLMLLTPGLAQLSGGCGITAKVTMRNGSVRTAEEAQTLALDESAVSKVEIWCRNTPPRYTIHHDNEQVYERTSSTPPRYVLERFAVEQQGEYRCNCQGGVGNRLNLVVIPGFHNNQFVGTAVKGDTVHLPCQLTNTHPGLSLYEVRWRRGDDNIVYGERYSKMTDNSLVIKDFQEDDTKHSYYCYITKIGSDDFGGNYPVSGPRQLRMLEEPQPEILTGKGTVSCSANTSFSARYCLTITYFNRQMFQKCKPKEVKARAEGNVKEITCEVTVFSNASSTNSFLSGKSTNNPGMVSPVTELSVSLPLAIVTLGILTILIVVLLGCCFVRWRKNKTQHSGDEEKAAGEQADGEQANGEQADGEQANGEQASLKDESGSVTEGTDCSALPSSRPPIPGGSAPSSLAAPQPSDSVQRQFFIRLPSRSKMSGRERRPASPAESIHAYVAPLQSSLRPRPTHLKCNLMVYSDHTLPSPPVVPQQPALPAPVVVHYQAGTGTNVDRLWPRTPPTWSVPGCHLNTPQARQAKVSPLALQSQSSVCAEDRSFYVEYTPLSQNQDLRIQNNAVAMVTQFPHSSSNGHDSALETSSSASSIQQPSPQESPETTPQLQLTSAH